MKRWLGLLLGIGLLLLGWSTFKAASASSDRCGLVAHRVSVVARGGPGRAFIGLDDVGEIPFIDPKTGETIVPLRSLFTILAEEGAVSWSESARTAQFRYGGHELTVRVAPEGSAVTTLLDGHPYPLRAYLCDGRLHGPLRSITEALDLEVRWYHADRTAVIDPVWRSAAQPQPEPAPVAPARPAACSSSEQVGWWEHVVRRTACALII